MNSKKTKKNTKSEGKGGKMPKKKETTMVIIILIIITISTHKSTINVHIIHFETTFMCPKSIAGVPSLLLHTTCVRSCSTWPASCVAAKHTKTKKELTENKRERKKKIRLYGKNRDPQLKGKPEGQPS